VNSPTALVVIDAQVNMFDPSNPVRFAEGLLDRLIKLVAEAHADHIPVVFIRNCGGQGDPDAPGTPGWELHPSLQPADGDLVLDKTTCDTFASTALGEELEVHGVTRIVIAGLQSDYCIRKTTQGALSRGLQVTLVSDGHSTYDGGGRTAADIIAAVNKEFENRADLVTAEKVRWRQP